MDFPVSQRPLALVAWCQAPLKTNVSYIFVSFFFPSGNYHALLLVIKRGQNYQRPDCVASPSSYSRYPCQELPSRSWSYRCQLVPEPVHPVQGADGGRYIQEGRLCLIHMKVPRVMTAHLISSILPFPSPDGYHISSGLQALGSQTWKMAAALTQSRRRVLG